MTRVSSAQIPQASLTHLSRAQLELIEAARQSSEQTKAIDLKGYGRSGQTLVSAQRLVARTESFLNTTKELQTRMQIQDVALGRASDAVIKLKEELFQNVGLESGEGVRSQLEEAFAVLKDAMNTNLGGRYLFGGVLNDQPPVTAATLSDLAADPLTDSIVQGADAQVMRVEENRTSQASLVAEDVISLAMASIKRIAEFDDGPGGPFGGDLTSAQKDTLMAELGQLSDAFDHILYQQAEHGRMMKEMDAAAERQTAQRDALNGAIGEIVDVDLAEVAVRLNQAQFAYDASAGVFNVIRNMSLLNVLK
jgi:flagellar hook-associated protein 3 FlgL